MSALSGLRNPAYTGENRCLPCTVLNLVLVAVLVVPILRFLGLPAATLVAAIGAGVVWVRGYLVPYTPRIAPELVALSPLPGHWFKKQVGGGSISGDEPAGEEVFEALVAAGVVRLDEEAVLMDSDFESEWHVEMSSLASQSLDELAAAAEGISGVESARPLRSEGKRWFVVNKRHSLVPYPILLAEVGAVRALPPSVPDGSVQLTSARMLRQFLETCPVCEADLVRSLTTGCCGSPKNASEMRVCTVCGHRLFTIPEPESADPPADAEPASV
ncbi:hypothetical protein [Halobacterium noricense]|jgi:hypothetical protein|uniref:hypothetical protein n=1 Tax=Halobacterium noricense TaxID=223182 RepID=UPI001E305960|nr:hypothetical protein [Halobacterium noricense]UHH27175.1 hypothetical protein LT974_16115 [Halobacterium noricense]